MAPQGVQRAHHRGSSTSAQQTQQSASTARRCGQHAVGAARKPLHAPKHVTPRFSNIPRNPPFHVPRKASLTVQASSNDRDAAASAMSKNKPSTCKGVHCYICHSAAAYIFHLSVPDMACLCLGVIAVMSRQPASASHCTCSIIKPCLKLTSKARTKTRVYFKHVCSADLSANKPGAKRIEHVPRPSNADGSGAGATGHAKAAPAHQMPPLAAVANAYGSGPMCAAVASTSVAAPCDGEHLLQIHVLLPGQNLANGHEASARNRCCTCMICLACCRMDYATHEQEL